VQALTCWVEAKGVLWRAGLVLLYLGAAVLVARLSSEATMMYYERHMIYGKRFDRQATPVPSQDSCICRNLLLRVHSI
jgi:hypothetical protein